MPIYEYECTSCCKVIEVIQRMTEDPLTNCPDCSGPVNKLVSKSSFQLKGGGWYADGYSSKSSGSNNSAGKSNGNGNQVKADKSPATPSKKTDSANPSSSKKSSTAAA